MLRTIVAVQTAVTALFLRLDRDDRGQTTAEYVLLLVGAAAMALLVVAWATKTGKVSTLLNKVVDSISSKVA